MVFSAGFMWFITLSFINMRMFLAINFEESENAVIAENKEILKDISVKGKFIRDENVHLTLAFFGEIPSERIEIIIKVMNDFPCGGAFSINFSEAGVFGKRGGDIWWIGIEKSEEVLRLQNSLTEAFRKEGFFLEKRQFSPHITLGREIVLKEGLGINEFQKKMKIFFAQVNRISLMKSERLDGKLTYTEISGKNLFIK